MIVEDDIAAVRDRVDLVDLVAEHTPVKRVGRHWQALCPFHGEKTPSFSINREAGLYFCFGCQAKGDAITFVRERDRVDFATAVEKLAGRAGVTLRFTDPAEGQRRSRRRVLADTMARAVDWYHERLLSAPDAAPARDYLAARGVTDDQVARHRIGWAPERSELARALGAPIDVLADAGLAYQRSGRPVDAFRARVMFPIFDPDGRPVGFGARVLPGGQGPKYRNSVEGPLYSKSRVLYGLDLAKGPAVAAGEVVVCEGYTDVIGLHAAGVPHAVATCGTALTEDHVKILTSYARRIVLAFDADAAGQAAAARFYEWETTYRVDVAVAAFPPGVDPADLAVSDPEALRATIAGARPFLGFRVDRLLAGAALNTPETRARAAREALALVAEHPDPLVRDQYLMDVAARCRLDPDRLRSSTATRRRPERAQPPAETRRNGQRSTLPGTELEALSLLVSDPDTIAPFLHDALFSHPATAAGYRALVDAPDVRTAVDTADAAVADLLRRVAVTATEADPGDVVDLLLRSTVARVLDDYATRLRADPGNEALFADYATVTSAAKIQVELLGDRAEHDAARDALLDWLRP